MKLYFRRSNEERKYIGEVDTLDGSFAMVKEYLKQYPHFKSYYTRCWVEDNELWYDVGSHTEFFVLTELNEDAIDSLNTKLTH